MLDLLLLQRKLVVMDKRELKLKLRNELLRVQSAKVTGPDQITMRCQICGDSIKDLSHGHFNIKINLNADEPVLFHCFRCDNGGVFTPSMLRSFKINDLSLNSGLISYNKQTMSLVNKSLGIVNNDFAFDIPIPKDDAKTALKKAYIEGRLGCKFTIEELIDLKVVFNLGEFLKLNGIEKLTVHKDKAIRLHNDYVGFLTAKNEFINFRDITGNNKRYDKYNVFNSLDNTRKFYNLPNEIDLLSTNDLVINIAEGVFDILGLYYHVYEQEKRNMIYTAVCGAGYISVLKYFIQMGVFGNVIINIYSDSDRLPWFYKTIKEELGIWVSQINLYYNQLGKDYGVEKDKIKIIKKRI